MISPSYSLTATERVLPKLALDFTTAALDPRVTFTRSGNTATVTNSSGVIVSVNADIPRFDYNPTTLLCNGLLIEESRTNVLLNSLIDGTILGTQAVVVTAAARTLSFYGTGQVVLSGAASATVTGTGAYPTRTTFTFTPSAGVLTLTVTGTVQFAQLEAGAFATSYIPTTVAQVTRTADVATMTGTNFSDWFNATEGTFAVTYIPYSTAASPSQRVIYADDGSTSNRVYFTSTSTNQIAVTSGGVSQAIVSAGTVTANQSNTVAGYYKANAFNVAGNATAGTKDTSGSVPVGVNNLRFFRDAGSTNSLFGHLQKMNFWNIAVTDAELAAFSK